MRFTIEDKNEIEEFVRLASINQKDDSGQTICFLLTPNLNFWKVKLSPREDNDSFLVYTQVTVFKNTDCAEMAANIVKDLRGLREQALKEKEERDKLVSLS